MSFLTRKYPFEQSRHWLRDSLAYSVIVVAILYFLQPFGFSAYPGNKFLATLSFGLVTFLCSLLYGMTVLRLMERTIKTWRIWHQGVAILGLIVFIAICNFLLFTLPYPNTMSLRFFLLFLYWTLIIGVIITAVSMSVSYNRHLRNQMESLLSNTSEEQEDISITIHDNNVRGNDLHIPINDLLYIEAQKNNVTVCYKKEGKTEHTDMHTTLTAVLEELADYENIFQCHRSFVVNLNNITSARGNSNGYQLTLGECTHTIPVSRTFVPKLKTFIA